MTPFTKSVAFALSLLVLLPAIAIVAAPRAGGPTISTPSISPSSPGPNDQVTVTTTVTAGGVGIQNVTLIYTTDNWKVNTTVVAFYNSTSNQAIAHIPAQYNGGHVQYYIIAFDNNNNEAISSIFSYTVAPPPASNTTSTWIELAIVATVLGTGGMFAFYSLRPKTRTGSTGASQN